MKTLTLLSSWLALPVIAMASGTSAQGAAHSLTNREPWGIALWFLLVALCVVVAKVKNKWVRFSLLYAVSFSVAMIFSRELLASGTSAAGVYCQTASSCAGAPIDYFGNGIGVAVGISSLYWILYCAL